MPLNRFQRVVADTHLDGHFAHIDDQREALADDPNGDTLFTFLMRELSDVTDQDEALRRLAQARLDITQLEREIFKL